MTASILSQLDRDLGLPAPADLNTLWSVALGLSPHHDPLSIFAILRQRYTPGGNIRCTYRQMAVALNISEDRAQRLVARALRSVRRALAQQAQSLMDINRRNSPAQPAPGAVSPRPTRSKNNR